MEMAGILENWTISEIYLLNIYLLISGTRSKGRIFKEKGVVGRRNTATGLIARHLPSTQPCSRCSAYVITTSTSQKDFDNFVSETEFWILCLPTPIIHLLKP